MIYFDEKFWLVFQEYLLRISGALIFFLISWAFSAWLGKRFSIYLKKTKLNQLFHRIGLEEGFNKIKLGMTPSIFFGKLLEWSLIILFLIPVSEILGLPQFGNFLNAVVRYLPNIFVAVIIFLVAAFAVDFSQKVVLGTRTSEKVYYSKIFNRALSWSIWILAVLAILYQLGITKNLILILFIGVVALLVLILGISFGLAGKDLAKKIIQEIEKKFK